MESKITLLIDNSYSRIQGLNPAQEKELKGRLSYTVGSYAGYYSGGYGPKKVSLLNKRGEFPTGLLGRVRFYFRTSEITVIDRRIKIPYGDTILPVPGSHEPYNAQHEALLNALYYGRGIISMPTGTGKSLVIELLSRTFSVQTLVVVPSLEIKKQIEAQLSWLKHVTIENIDSPALKTMTDFDMLIIDECHHVAAKTYRMLNKKVWNKIYYRFFLTATPFRNDTEETLLFESIAGEVIYQLSYEDAVKQKLIVPVESYFLEIPKQETDAYTWAEVYSQLVVNNKVRNAIIAELLLSLGSVYTLCLVKEVAHGKILSELTGIPFVHGTDDDSRKYITQFKEGKILSLIGTEGILGEGVDSKPCEYVVVAGLGKAKSAFQQKIGRAVRRYGDKESAKVIIFKDKSHRFLTRHFKAQCDILNTEYGVKPIKLELK